LSNRKTVRRGSRNPRGSRKATRSTPEFLREFWDDAIFRDFPKERVMSPVPPGQPLP